MAAIRLFPSALLVIAGGVFLTAGHAGAQMAVDLALVLAVDVSQSMEPDEKKLQRDGFVAAFRSSAAHAAI